MKKIYYKIRFKLKSAMNIGCGVNDNSDRDVLKDSKGLPYIPGTSLAGLYRSLFDDEEAKEYFGNVEINTKKGSGNSEAIESKVKVYDAYVVPKTVTIQKRDCVGLDEYKTAVKGAKFDFEVVERGAEFVTYIEQDVDSEDFVDVGGRVLYYWQKEGLSIGSKTMRGLGRTGLVEEFRAEFDLGKDLDNWLVFDMYEDKPELWGTPLTEEKIKSFALLANDKDRIKIALKLKQKGSSGISIRKYTTEINTTDKPQPDYEQLTSLGKPIIPGTSWAGSFKHQMESFLENKRNSEKWFGTTSRKSSISFSESVIENAKDKMITRNAIDRFSGGTVDGALYTEKYYHGGNTELDIFIPKKIKDSELLKKTLVAAIFDLHFGFMAIEGLTAVGRGLFDITDAQINNQPVDIPTETNAAACYQQWIEKIVLGEVKDNGNNNQ